MSENERQLRYPTSPVIIQSHRFVNLRQMLKKLTDSMDGVRHDLPEAQLVVMKTYAEELVDYLNNKINDNAKKV